MVSIDRVNLVFPLFVHSAISFINSSIHSNGIFVSPFINPSKHPTGIFMNPLYHTIPYCIYIRTPKFTSPCYLPNHHSTNPSIHQSQPRPLTPPSLPIRISCTNAFSWTNPFSPHQNPRSLHNPLCNNLFTFLP